MREVALVARRRRPRELGELAAIVRAELRPHVVLAGGIEGATSPELMLSAARSTAGRRLRLRTLRLPAPVTDPADLAAALDG